MAGHANKLVVIGNVPRSQYEAVFRKLRRLNGQTDIVRVPEEYFPVWDDGYELFFLMMGHSAMDGVAIARKYACSTEEAYQALWSDIADSFNLKIGDVVGVVFPFDLGWVPDDMAELFMSHLPADIALRNIFPVRRGKILQPDSYEYNGVYRIFADYPQNHP